MAGRLDENELLDVVLVPARELLRFVPPAYDERVDQWERFRRAALPGSSDGD